MAVAEYLLRSESALVRFVAAERLHSGAQVETRSCLGTDKTFGAAWSKRTASERQWESVLGLVQVRSSPEYLATVLQRQNSAQLANC